METSRRLPSPEEPVSELRRIPIHDNGEPLVELERACPELHWMERHPVFAYRRFRLVRAGVAQRLQAAAGLLSAGIRLGVVEGYRAPAIQAAMYAATDRRIREAHPDWRENHLRRAINRFSARPDPRVPPPHTTGGAVDVVLVTPEGIPLDFNSPFDPLDTSVARTAARGLSETARRNRCLLQSVMAQAGFTNYPVEWWHWSWGDPGWAYRGQHPCAHYGLVEPPELSPEHLDFRVHSVPGWD